MNLLPVNYIIHPVHIPVNCMCICTGKCSRERVFVVMYFMLSLFVK